MKYINPFIKVSNNTLSVETEKESVEEVVEEFKNLYNIGTIIHIWCTRSRNILKYDNVYIFL